MKSLARIAVEDVLDRESSVLISKARLEMLEEAERSLRLFKRNTRPQMYIIKCNYVGCKALYITDHMSLTNSNNYDGCENMSFCRNCGMGYCNAHSDSMMDFERQICCGDFQPSSEGE